MATPRREPEETGKGDREEGRGAFPDEERGGGHRVHEHPPDTPGDGRGVGLGLIAILAFLVVAIPVAWGLGVLAALGRTVGDVANVIIWIVWILVIAALIGIFRSMWRRAA